jgi:predicted outer membrane repeat protein
MSLRRSLATVSLTAAVVLAACGSDSQKAAGGGDDGGLPSRDGAGDAPSGVVDGGGGRDALGSGDGNAVGDGPPPAVEAGPPNVSPPTCSVPIQPADTSAPTTVVGNGVASSCTVPSLIAAVAKGGVVTFNCGGPFTFALTQPIELSIAKDTVIDGGGKIALDGGSAIRVLDFNSPNFRATRTTVTLQHLEIVHGKATGTAIPTAPGKCSQGTNIDGGGAGIFVRDGILHVIDVAFLGNTAASTGPDVGGGAIYAEGSLDVTVVDSSFVMNSGSNGGAIGSLNSDITLVNDTFTGNTATGSGGNSIDSSCPVNGGEVGNGGNSGAVAIDGGSDGTATICGCVFSQNTAGAFGGALFRTADAATQTVTIDQTTFDGNTSVSGGGAMYIHNCNLDITASALSNNTSSASGGAIQADGTTVRFVNDTFAGNSARKGLGGAMALFSSGTTASGTIQNVTFANNHADGGPGFFAGAIAGGATLDLHDTIFWDDTTQDCGSPVTCQIGGGSTAQAVLQWPQNHMTCISADTPCTTSGTTFADAQLSPLTANGGPTLTMIPKAGSPAIGAGTSCPATDQRGFARKPDGCTIGAVEPP